MKKLLCFTLAAALALSTFGVASAESDYVYAGATTGAGTSVGYTIESENPATTPHIYQLGEDEVYCADFFSLVQSGATYTKSEWTDSLLKAILEFGYKSNWTEEQLSALSIAAGCTDLTREQALAATQIAIWNTIHGDSTITFYDEGSTELNPNIEAVRTYLKGKNASEPYSLDITEMKMENVQEFADAEGVVYYTFDIKFKLSGVTNNTVKLQCDGFNDTTPVDWILGEDGYYTVQYSGSAYQGLKFILVYESKTGVVYKYNSSIESQTMVGYEEASSIVEKSIEPTIEIVPEPDPEPETPHRPSIPEPEPTPEPEPVPEPEEPIIEEEIPPVVEDEVVDEPPLITGNEVPKTGDSGDLLFWCAVALMAGMYGYYNYKRYK